jgi:prepilin-type N-terminal cleavage/methylation domain-containing protein
MKERKSHSTKGFTLIEILLVVGIIGLLLLASYPSLRNTLKTRDLENRAREVLTSFQQAKFQSVKFKLNHRVRFDNSTGHWIYYVERETSYGVWQSLPGWIGKSLPSSFVVTVNLPIQQIIFTPLGLVQNYNPTLHSVSLQNPDLSTVSQSNVRIINVFAGGSIQYVKP